MHVKWDLEPPTGATLANSAVLDAPPVVLAEADRLLARLWPELVTLLAGKQPFRIEIHGKPGAKCRVHVMRFDVDR